VHCAVGKYPANGFGLHEVTGNVWEWCLDGYNPFFGTSAVRNPVSPWPGRHGRVCRGGSFDFRASLGRTAYRFDFIPELKVVRVGLRPSRGITP
jgi:sulfatase modifying factor 1